MTCRGSSQQISKWSSGQLWVSYRDHILAFGTGATAKAERSEHRQDVWYPMVWFIRGISFVISP